MYPRYSTKYLTRLANNIVCSHFSEINFIKCDAGFHPLLVQVRVSIFLPEWFCLVLGCWIDLTYFNLTLPDLKEVLAMTSVPQKQIDCWKSFHENKQRSYYGLREKIGTGTCSVTRLLEKKRTIHRNLRMICTTQRCRVVTRVSQNKEATALRSTTAFFENWHMFLNHSARTHRSSKTNFNHSCSGNQGCIGTRIFDRNFHWTVSLV